MQDKIDQHVDLALCELIAERDHSITAIRNVLTDLTRGLVLVLAIAEVWNQSAVVERAALGLGAVADRTVLTEKRCFVALVICDRNAAGIGCGTGVEN